MNFVKDVRRYVAISGFRRTHCQKNNTENLVDKDVQSFLFPLNLLQNIMFYPKYAIRNNLIQPNSALTICLSLCVTTVSILIFFYRTYNFHYDNAIRKYLKKTYIISYFDIIFYSIGFIINNIVSLLLTKNNISFVLKIQEIHRFVNEKKHFKRFVIWNWIQLISTICIYVTILTALSITLQLPCHQIIAVIVLLCFDVNMMYAINLIALLSHKLNLWKIRVQNLQHQCTCQVDNETYCKIIFKTFVNILECYNIIKISFQYMIVYHTIQFVCHVLANVQSTIDCFKYSLYTGQYYPSFVNLISLYVWVAKSWWLQISLTFHYVKFYMAMNNIQDSCALILNSNCTDAEKRLCKNVKRLHRATFNKMCVCGMFYIDATLPLKMMALIANYTIVLLQFTIMSLLN